MTGEYVLFTHQPPYLFFNILYILEDKPSSQHKYNKKIKIKIKMKMKRQKIVTRLQFVILCKGYYHHFIKKLSCFRLIL
jgi:hypothetical protein